VISGFFPFSNKLATALSDCLSQIIKGTIKVNSSTKKSLALSIVSFQSTSVLNHSFPVKSNEAHLITISVQSIAVVSRVIFLDSFKKLLCILVKSFALSSGRLLNTHKNTIVLAKS
jgi:hypothetical protein